MEPAPPEAPKAWSCRTRPSAMPLREPASASPENPAVPVAANATGNDKTRLTGWLARLMHGKRPSAAASQACLIFIKNTHDGKRVVSGKSVSVRVSLGGRGIIKKELQKQRYEIHN